MSREESFIRWFDGLGCRHFTGKELAPYFKRNKNTFPPASLRKNFVETIRVLDDLRGALGKPITITSSYRSPAYNAGVGGKSRSLHLKFNAIDFQVKGVSPKKVHAVLVAMRSAGRFKGGVGLYSTFVHVDTRGYSASW